MPTYFGDEGDNPRPTDNERRSLQKINNILRNGGGSSVVSGNPVVQTAKADTTALAANPSRKSAFIQNNGTNVMLIKEGAGCSAGSFSASIPGGSGNDDGRGGTYNIISDDIITVFGTGLRYSVTEVS